MSRPLRLEFAGALYHITSRGNGRNLIYLQDDDFELFLQILANVCERYNWVVHAYCLMNNHYHLLVETPDANLSQGMRQLNGVFTQSMDRKHHRVGHLFQGRYKTILVDKDAYLLELCRYIVLNPVRASIVNSPEEYSGLAGIACWATLSRLYGCRQILYLFNLLRIDKIRSKAILTLLNRVLAKPFGILCSIRYF
jgi:REP element-mobilizing transposase RayT